MISLLKSGLFILLGLSFSACLVTEDEVLLSNVNYDLQEPELSTSGEGTFSCRINGELFIGKNFFTAWYNDKTLPNIYHEYPNGMIQFFSSQEFKGNRRNLILLARPMTGSSDYEIIDYHPGPPHDMYSSYDDHQIEGIYWLDKRHPAHIKILRNDKEVIAGTFECSFQNKFGDLMRITNGKIDLSKL